MSKNFVVYVGTKTYSSWSLRGWLAAKATLGSDFEEMKFFLAGDGAPVEKIQAARAEILRYSPSGKLPAILDREMGNTVIYDSLAINIYLADRRPDANLLPRDFSERGLCLAACAEMHSGFPALRSNWPHHCLSTARAHGAQTLATKPELRGEIERLGELWSSLRARFASRGPYLFGSFTAADCMYAPVALRFNTYDPDLSTLSGFPAAAEYVRTILSNKWVQEWIAEAGTEGPEWKIPQYELYSDK